MTFMPRLPVSARLWLGLSLWAFVPGAPAAVNFFDPADPQAVPALLSETGIYADLANKVPDTALKHYEVNAALWSDGAAKDRWIVLPPGESVPYLDDYDVLDFPDGTFFVKNFYLDSVSGVPATRTYWETRLLINKATPEGYPNWYGFTYRWNADASEAFLVPPFEGLDTVFIHRTAADGDLTYKKWRFPDQTQCNECHLSGGYGGPREDRLRGVLGFLPAQLKRPPAADSLPGQVDALFDAGVFSGVRPDSAQLARRWKSIRDPIPAALSPEARFAVIDTMVRSYIAANCSGCHRGPAPRAGLDLDFHALVPRVDVAEAFFEAGLNYEDAEETLGREAVGRYKYVHAVARAGFDTSAGATWEMTFPRNGFGAPLDTRLVRAGHPAFSVILYRQLAARNTPWTDSIEAAKNLPPGDPMRTWLFAEPWGSRAWLDSLEARDTDIDSVISFENDPYQMPPLATHLPDLEALEIMGEWVKTYRTLVVNTHPGKGTVFRIEPRIHGRILKVPSGWGDRVRIVGVDGRSRALEPLGNGRFRIPGDVPAGPQLFRSGNGFFRAIVEP